MKRAFSALAVLILAAACRSAPKGAAPMGGIGVRLHSVEGKVKVLEVAPGSPASAAGLRVGDVLLAVDDSELHGLAMEQIVELLRGPVGSEVRLLLEGAQPAERRLLRARPPKSP